MDGFFQEISINKLLNVKSVRNIVLELTVILDNILIEYDSNLQKMLKMRDVSDKILNGFFTIDELKKWFKDITMKTMYFVKYHKKSENKKTIEEIVAYIDKNYFKKISLTSVAEKFYINPTYLSRIFKVETGFNFSDYINKKRMNVSASLIKDNTLKLKDISEMVGYDNINYFFRKFKNHFGCTPSEYKSQF